MLSKVQPCFQLLRIGSSSSSSPPLATSDTAQDLYTFRPALPRSVFRLGRKAELCDVTLPSTMISRIHAELLAEREQDSEGQEGWHVRIKDRSSSGTWVNDVRVQPGVEWELSDGDTLTFGGQSSCGSPEFYFLFQKVLVRPSEFDAITVPKADSFTSDLQDRIRTSLEPNTEPSLDISTLSINRATVILNSIGSISKMNGSCWRFKKTVGSVHVKPGPLNLPSLVPPSSPSGLPLATMVSTPKSAPPVSKSRRKSAHTVLLEDDSSEETRSGGSTAEGRRKGVSKRRRLCKSECEAFHPSQLEQYGGRHFEITSEPKSPNGFHLSLPSKTKLTHLFSASGQRQGFSLKIKMDSGNGNPSSAFQREPLSPSARGRRRANSSPAGSTLVSLGGDCTLLTPSSRLCEAEGADKGDFSGGHISTGKRRGRPRKHPPGSTPSALPSGAVAGERARAEEPCASACCRMPQQDTVQWIQCDDCDAWYHIDCAQQDVGASLDTSADFHCGCQ